MSKNKMKAMALGAVVAGSVGFVNTVSADEHVVLASEESSLTVANVEEKNSKDVDMNEVKLEPVVLKDELSGNKDMKENIGGKVSVSNDLIVSESDDSSVIKASKVIADDKILNNNILVKKKEMKNEEVTLLDLEKDKKIDKGSVIAISDNDMVLPKERPETLKAEKVIDVPKGVDLKLEDIKKDNEDYDVAFDNDKLIFSLKEDKLNELNEVVTLPIVKTYNESFTPVVTDTTTTTKATRPKSYDIQVNREFEIEDNYNSATLTIVKNGKGINLSEIFVVTPKGEISLKEGENVLNDLTPGKYSLRINGRSESIEKGSVSFELNTKGVVTKYGIKHAPVALAYVRDVSGSRASILSSSRESMMSFIDGVLEVSPKSTAHVVSYGSDKAIGSDLVYKKGINTSETLETLMTGLTNIMDDLSKENETKHKFLVFESDFADFNKSESGDVSFYSFEDKLVKLSELAKSKGFNIIFVADKGAVWYDDRLEKQYTIFGSDEDRKESLEVYLNKVVGTDFALSKDIKLDGQSFDIVTEEYEVKTPSERIEDATISISSEKGLLKIAKAYLVTSDSKKIELKVVDGKVMDTIPLTTKGAHHVVFAIWGNGEKDNLMFKVTSKDKVLISKKEPLEGDKEFKEITLKGISLDLTLNEYDVKHDFSIVTNINGGSKEKGYTSETGSVKVETKAEPVKTMPTAKMLPKTNAVSGVALQLLSVVPIGGAIKLGRKKRNK